MQISLLGGISVHVNATEGSVTFQARQNPPSVPTGVIIYARVLTHALHTRTHTHTPIHVNRWSLPCSSFIRSFKQPEPVEPH